MQICHSEDVSRTPKMNFAGQGSKKLEHEQDRETHAQTDATERITTAIFACAEANLW